MMLLSTDYEGKGLGRLQVEHGGERAWRTGSSPPADHRSGVTEKSIRKLVGPSKPVENEQLALPAIPTTTEKPTSGVSSATPSGGEGNRATQSTENKADDRDPITAPEAANDDEPGIVFEVGADMMLDATDLRGDSAEARARSRTSRRGRLGPDYAASPEGRNLKRRSGRLRIGRHARVKMASRSASAAG